MGSSDPELRMRQLAQLRAAYHACPGLPDDHTGNSTARHSRALLARILVALSGPAGDVEGRAIGEGRKACADT